MAPVQRARIATAAAASSGAALASRAASLVVVPFALDGLGSDVYGAWVVATVVATSQGLVDLGARTAVVRYTALGAAAGDPAAVGRALRLVGIPYALLAASFVAAGLALSGSAVRWLDVPASAAGEARLMLISGLATFALLAVQSILVGLLSGLQQAAAAYRAVTFGSAAYAAVAVGGYLAGHPVAAMAACGPAMGVVQIAVLVGRTRAALAGLGGVGEDTAAGAPPAAREVLGFSVSMQLVTLADFAVLQVPRVLAAVALGAGAIVSLDVALRVGSLVAGVMIMALPGVLPALSWDWSRGRSVEYAGTTLRITRLIGAAGVCIVLAVALSGHAMVAAVLGEPAASPAWQLTVVAAAMALHALTGPLTVAAQARGAVAAILALKGAIAATFAIAIAVAWPLEVTEVAAAVAVALAAPSLVFCAAQWRLLARLGGSSGPGLWRDLAVLGAAGLASWGVRQLPALGELPSALLSAAVLAAGAGAVTLRLVRAGALPRPGLRRTA